MDIPANPTWKTPLWMLRLLVALLFVYSGCTPGVFAATWRQAIEPWTWMFPRDHGLHPQFRTEWWYVTGNLRDESGKRFGYQLTFFRHGIVFEARRPSNPWSIRDVYSAHFTLTDVSGNQFWQADRLCRKGPGLAGASGHDMNVWLLNWSVVMRGRKMVLEARHQDMAISLELVPRKPMVFHGLNGLSAKGSEIGQASYYFSYTDLKTEGRLTTPVSSSPIQVTGTSWFDHEFGSNQLASDQAGWDWFSLHLSSGQDLMIYFLRRTDGSVEPASSGTLVSPTGKAMHLELRDISVDVRDHWISPKSGGRYPSRWRVRVAPAGIDLLIKALVAAQELTTEGSTGVTYWEGAVEGAGRSAAKEVTCEGYVEMTGYAGTLGGLF